MILITGGLGYLGGRIASKLVFSGLSVRIASSRKNPKVPKVLSSCDIVHIDFSNVNSLEAACKDISIILHLAGINAQTSEDDPESALLVNGLGTLKLLQAAEKKEVSRFLFFSTVHIYGSPIRGKIDETVLPIPSNHYSITNRLAEDYVLLANRHGKISGAIVRLSNVVGKPIDDGSNCWSLVVNDLCRQAIESQYLKLTSDGKQQRDFITISDVCDIVGFLIELPFNQYRGEIFNIGGKVYTIYEIALLIAERYHSIFGTIIRVEIGKNPIKEIISNDFHFNTNKLENLGFKLNNNLRSEVDLLLQYCANK